MQKPKPSNAKWKQHWEQMVKQNPLLMTNRSSTVSYRSKSSKGGKEMTYCSACGKPDHNTSKCKKKHTLFFDFCNRHRHAAKPCRHRMNRPNICVHCQLDHGNKPCPDKEDLRNSPSTTGLPKPQRYNLILQPNIPRPYGFDTYPPLESNRPNGFRSRWPNENQIFSPSGWSTSVGSPKLEQFNQTLLAHSTQNQMAKN